MLSFGKRIKYKVKYKNKDDKSVSSVLTCVNENEAIQILKSINALEFKELISCKKFEECEDCKL